MSKQNDIQNFINANIGYIFTTGAICDACHCSLPTVLSYIKNNSNRFQKIKRGSYLILADTNVLTVETHTHEW